MIDTDNGSRVPVAGGLKSHLHTASVSGGVEEIHLSTASPFCVAYSIGVTLLRSEAGIYKIGASPKK